MEEIVQFYGNKTKNGSIILWNIVVCSAIQLIISHDSIVTHIFLSFKNNKWWGVDVHVYGQVLCIHLWQWLLKYIHFVESDRSFNYEINIHALLRNTFQSNWISSHFRLLWFHYCHVYCQFIKCYLNWKFKCCAWSSCIIWLRFRNKRIKWFILLLSEDWKYQSYRGGGAIT